MDKADFDSSYTDKSKYRLWTHDIVRFNDLDALGHVGSVRMIEFFASARTQLFQQAVPGWPLAPQIPVLKLNVVQHEAEICYPQKLETGLAVEKFGTKSVTLIMGLFDDTKCAALCRNVFVFIDNTTRLAIIPDDIIKQNFLKFAI